MIKQTGVIFNILKIGVYETMTEIDAKAYKGLTKQKKYTDADWKPFCVYQLNMDWPSLVMETTVSQSQQCLIIVYQC